MNGTDGSSVMRPTWSILGRLDGTPTYLAYLGMIALLAFLYGSLIIGTICWIMHNLRVTRERQQKGEPWTADLPRIVGNTAIVVGAHEINKKLDERRERAEEQRKIYEEAHQIKPFPKMDR
jgi:hypothetical protein